jgi:hypothetical protein
LSEVLNVTLLAVALLAVLPLFHSAVRDAPLWRATVTPLASIIGSGFLIAGPLLTHIVGAWAPMAMLGILAVAFWIGAIIRFNIVHAEALLARSDAPVHLVTLQRVSDLTLALAYVVSVAFYVRLLASFVLGAGSGEDAVLANTLTTAVLLSIAMVGWLRGLGGLERLEEVAVATKVAIIVALLVGLAHFDATWLGTGDSLVDTNSDDSLVERLRLLAGLLLIVQGFETSRYLGASYDPSLRVKSMKLAQLIAGAIYLFFVILGLPLLVEFHSSADETAIINLAGRVASVLPGMIVVAAAMSQFSAAVADTAGAGGLLNELSRGRFSPRQSYLYLLSAAIALVWTANVFQIVALASRAFAIYYLLQCVLAVGVRVRAIPGTQPMRNLQLFMMTLMVGLLLIVAVFARPLS